MESSLVESTSAIELKGGMFTLTVLRVLEPNLDTIAHALTEKVRQAPGFFRNIPVILDLQALAPAPTALELVELLGIIRNHGMIPVGARNPSPEQRDVVAEVDLAILRDSERPRKGRAHVPAPATEAEPNAPKDKEQEKSADSPNGSYTQIIDRPVRSGQQIYSPGGDLLVIAQVSPGSELLADGNIHVYGSLRGRALAGLSGNKEARILCLGLEAELVSIAGTYRVFDDIDEALKGQPAQVRLEQDQLTIKPIKTGG